MTVDQEQFLDVIDRDEAERRFHQAVDLALLQPETVPINRALGRVLASDVVAWVDVPSFDRSNFDGFAVRSMDTYGATEESPLRVRLLEEVIAASLVPSMEIERGMAVSIATGGMLPRGADAVVMVEHTDPDGQELLVRRSVNPGFGVAFAGTDIAAGETVLRCGQKLTSRETGVLAAIGVREVSVRRRPRVGVVSTGDEIVAPGEPMRPGLVYDSNARIIADAVIEQGGEPVELGIVRDDVGDLRGRVQAAMESCDIVLLSGGTSKGSGDLSYRVVSELENPGIVVHGVALKPGKPICLAATDGKAVVILPGFPTSAIFTFHEFVVPIIQKLAGCGLERSGAVQSQMAVKVNSEIGRTEYLLVGLVHGRGEADLQPRLVAYPMGKGSGSVTNFSRADGFVAIDRHQEILEAGSTVSVQLLGRDLRPADLVVMGSHCIGLEYLLGRLQSQGFCTKFLAVGSTAGLEAIRRGECDLAGVHLLDPTTGQFNRPFVSADLDLIPGYGRMQGVLHRAGDERFAGRSAAEAVNSQKHACRMVNRNQGSGTRILIDTLLEGTKPEGYAIQVRNHNAVAAAVAQGRADWGLAIRSVADRLNLGFLPLAEEQYDFVVAKSWLDNPVVGALQALLVDAKVQQRLSQLGLRFEQRV